MFPLNIYKYLKILGVFMPLSPNEYLHKAGGNLARPTNYTVFLEFPGDLTRNSSFEGQIYDILCKTATLPATKNIGVDYIYKGHKIQVPSRSDYDRTFACTFLLDNNQFLQVDFQDWIASLDSTYVNHSAKALSAYEDAAYQETKTYGSMVLIAKDWNGNETAQYVFEGLYPSSVSGVEFNGDSVSSILELTVEFNFLRYTIVPSNSSATQGFIESLVNDTITSLASAIKDLGDELTQPLEDSLSTPLKKLNDFEKNKQTNLDTANKKFKEALRLHG